MLIEPQCRGIHGKGRFADPPTWGLHQRPDHEAFSTFRRGHIDANAPTSAREQRRFPDQDRLVLGKVPLFHTPRASRWPNAHSAHGGGEVRSRESGAGERPRASDSSELHDLDVVVVGVQLPVTARGPKLHSVGFGARDDGMAPSVRLQIGALRQVRLDIGVPIHEELLLGELGPGV